MITIHKLHYETIELGNMDSLGDIHEAVTEWEHYETVEEERMYVLQVQRHGGPGDWEVYDFQIPDEPIKVSDDLPF